MIRFMDNNIGEMFNDILKETTDSLFKDVVDGTKDVFSDIGFSWKMIIPIATIIVVILLSLIIKNAGQKRRDKLNEASTIEDFRNEDIISFVSKEIESNPKTEMDLGDLFTKETKDEPKASVNLDLKSQIDEIIPKTKKEEKNVVINQQKIEIVSKLPFAKFGSDNNNTTRSGKVFTEDELKEIIRK